jgi:O-antigen/teichoic acid export membrane protein
VVDAVYGLPEFAGTVPVLRWLAFAIVVYSLGHLAGILVLVRRPGRVTVIATAVVAVFNVALNAVLIPAYSAEGAAAATLVTEALLAVIVLFLARPVAGWPHWSRAGAGAVLAGVAMGAAMWGVRDDLLLALPLGAVAYLAVLGLFEARSLSGDLAAVRAVLRRQGPPAPAPAPVESALAP